MLAIPVRIERDGTLAVPAAPGLGLELDETPFGATPSGSRGAPAAPGTPR